MHDPLASMEKRVKLVLNRLYKFDYWSSPGERISLQNLHMEMVTSQAESTTSLSDCFQQQMQSPPAEARFRLSDHRRLYVQRFCEKGLIL